MVFSQKSIKEGASMVIASKHQQPVLDKVQLNKDIEEFPQVHPITEDMTSNTKVCRDL